MIVIGINGYVGSGKTTISKLLFNDKNKRIIHLDSLFDETKRKYFEKDINVLKQSDGTELLCIDENSKIKKILKIKQLKGIYTFLKMMYAHKLIENIIQKSLNDGLDYLIIEGRNLDVYELDKLCDVKIYVSSGEVTRYIRALDRDKERFDKSYFYKEPSIHILNIDGYIRITNNSDLDSLKIKVIQLEEKIKCKTLHK